MNVGVKSTWTVPLSTATSFTTPRSTSEMTGISGSGISASASQTSSAVTIATRGSGAPHHRHLLPQLGELRLVDAARHRLDVREGTPKALAGAGLQLGS